ncbi:MAG: 4Fe-4S dicluster domain-containing protein [Anaerolineae bacterium]
MAERADSAADVFYVDLARCTGCFTCVIACKDRADLPDNVDWIRVERNEYGLYPRVRLAFRVVHCFHCERPSCLEACPVAAIVRDADGWVHIVREACTGCGACVAACPFGAVTLGADDTATKCDGCPDEVAAGVGPTCVRACPMRALTFGAAGGPGRPRMPDAGWDDRGIGPRVSYVVRRRVDKEQRDG